MQVNEVDLPRVRELAGLQANGAKVVSLYLDLDPSDFATAQARSSEISSVLDALSRAAREDGLSHAERAALRADCERVRDYFAGGEFTPDGAHGIALFCSSASGVFEALRLAEPVSTTVVVDDTPWLEPLIGREQPRRCVVLVSRRTLRAFGDRRDGSFAELGGFADEVHQRHDQGGWSQARYERSVEQEVDDHLKRAARALFALWRRRRIGLLAVGAAQELYPRFEQALHPYLREQIVGRFDADVENATADDALAAAAPLFEAHRERHVQELIERLRAGSAKELGAAGIADTLRALTERRVEALLYESGFSAPGASCDNCGWIGEPAESCPACAQPAQRQDNVLEPAISAALLQSAEVVPLQDRPDLGPLGGIGAVLRF